MNILLKENTAAAESTINQLGANYQRGKKLLETLKKMGFEAGSVTDWQEVEKHFHTNPDWTLEFCLQSKGYTETFAEAKELFKPQNRYEPITETEKEEIKEQNRVYASDRQKEALQLVNSVVNDLNTLKSEFEFPLNFFVASQLFYPFRQSKDYQKVEINNDGLLPYLQKLK